MMLILTILCCVAFAMQVKAASDAHPTGDETQQPSSGSQTMGNVVGGNAAYNATA
jgi:hypothetical protein